MNTTTIAASASAWPKLSLHFPTTHPRLRASAFPPSSIQRAALRFHESNKPDPLLLDPYAGCFLPSPPDPGRTAVPETSDYVLATSFIDDRLIEAMRCNDELRQVVLFSDGMDTRPFRLRWPRSMLIYDVSPGRVFRVASRTLEGFGAKLPRTCMLYNIPFESLDLQQCLCQKGFSGIKPSFWILQGLPLATLAEFEKLLSVVGALAMEGCVFLGELPAHLIKMEYMNKNGDTRKSMERTFMTHGFQVDVIDYDEVAREKHWGPLSGSRQNLLFAARQLRMSDDQMEMWRMEFQRIEEEGDEEGFEDMIV